MSDLSLLIVISCSTDVNTPDSFGKSPLHNAILGKNVDVVKLLLKSGADVKRRDERGDTPLHAAVRADSEAIVVVRMKNYLGCCPRKISRNPMFPGVDKRGTQNDKCKELQPMPNHDRKGIGGWGHRC